jgi:DMSO/TMAO reductase YedYZ molybdopterin-dependent catalytic subunit
MQRVSPATGALLGSLTMAPVLALSYLAFRIAGLPFLPFDLFDWLARVLPGDLVTFGIDTMVTILRAAGVSTSSAKVVEQFLALALMVVVGGLLGAGIALALVRSEISGGRLGLTAGWALFALFVVVEGALSFSGSALVVFGWVGLLLIGWGVVLGNLIANAQAVSAASPERRRFLFRAGITALALTFGGWGLGRLLGPARASEEAGQPLAASGGAPSAPELPAPPAGRIDPVPGTRAEITSNDDFYRIDINSLPPVIQAGAWQLEVAGLFRTLDPLTIEAVMAYPPVTQPITLSCISNRIAGDLIGTSYWTGARLRDVLEDLGLQPEAGALYLEAQDGFYETVVAEDMMDERTLLVYAMNGETLPVEHGFPLRIYIPNRYGMKQPKWIVRMEAVEAWLPGYWVERGWSREARPHIVSVIDTVAREADSSGVIPVGGIAWAGDRGISSVEVSVDDGPWQEAALRTPPLSGLTWVQWRYEWQASRGRHTFTVRATDGNGELQTAEVTGVRPDGATGYHSVTARI